MSEPVALITGAASGIGRALSVALAHRGWALAALDCREDGLVALAAELDSHKRRCAWAVADVTRAGELAGNVHRAVADAFAKHGFALGHLSGHSIGTTMIEHPAIGAKSEVALEENMIFSLHPQVVDQGGKVCLYTQDTYRIGRDEGECLADVPWQFFTGQEARAGAAR